MSTSRELVEQLLQDGMSKAEIARAVGRDSSVISQITAGRKPYANLVPTLEALAAQRQGQEVTVPRAPRRVAKSGQLAQVRRRTAGGRTVRVHSKSAIKGGAKSIANRLATAARQGLTTAWTVVYPPDVQVIKSPKYGDKRSHHAGGGQENTADFGGVPATEMHQYVTDAGGDVGQGVTAWLMAHDYLDSDEYTPVSIEMRTYRP